MERTIIVLDNFYKDPNRIREIALASSFDVSGNYPGMRTKGYNELGVCSFWIGSYKESFDICDKLLKMDIPEDDKSRIKENREFAREKLWKIK